ncbi:MAG: 23S rRNA (cytidine(2498)-2'-O)-methyltransferase RlmM [Gammaproteobacteria bacterium]
MQQLLITCRAGLESDIAAEIQGKAAAAGVPGFVRAQANQGFIVFEGYQPDSAEHLVQRLPFSELIFARQWMVVLSHVQLEEKADRVSPILEALGSGPAFHGCWLTFPDTNDGKSLSRLTRKLERPLFKALSPLEKSPGKAGWVAQVFFLSGDDFWVGLTPVKNASPWELGYPRLRQPSTAPSRSTLKLEEAWLQLIPEHLRAIYIKPFQKAVDLGAAPGGWTWQLVHRGMQVVAVDNGPMDKGLMDSGQVTHLREDAFTYKPPRQVDWLVCDIVEKPARVAELMERWLTKGWCRFAVFNLKLPMKKRWQEVDQILTRLRDELDAAGIQYQLAARQLYHDREEITVFVGPKPV